jgi:predicted adenylyl cyclase CyaB
MPLAASTDLPRRNLELKVRLDPTRERAVRAAMRALGVPIERQRQVDRYFAVPAGRLKLRTVAYDTEPSRAELIAYRRPDEAGSRWSAYRITPLDPPAADDLAATLGHVLPALVEVRKLREIAIWSATRIHLDAVEGLGWFAELETVLDGQGDDGAAAEHREVIDRLGLAALPVEAGSYSDLLARQERQ